MISRHLTPASRFEHAPVAILADSLEASRSVASEIASLIRARRSEGRKAVLGLATGSTPVSVYAELVRLHREEGLSFADVVTFNLDEYYPMGPDDPRSYHRFMQEHLFGHVDIPPGQVHLPDGSVPKPQVDPSCAAYEEAIREAGGIDLQILGIGRTGHIGFNEPGSPRRSPTRLVALDPLTRRDAAGDFGGDEHTPHFALTMGVRTILAARRIVLMAWGSHKAEVVRAAVEGEVSSQVTASFLQEHDDAVFVLDEPAAGALTRSRTPWLLGPLAEQGLAWNDRMTRRAILWLSQLRGKAILKLTDDDYNEAGLQDLLRVHASAYEANLAGFYDLQHTITGWPGGRDPQKTRPGDAPVRALRAPSASRFPKRILVLSPHPDDNVVSMGGTVCRLVDQGHEVHIAFEVSGAAGVPDEAIWRALAFARDSGLAAPGRAGEIASLASALESGQGLPADGRTDGWKGLIRRHEAIAASRACGVPPERLHFLNLPFYASGGPRRRHIGDRDVAILHELLARLGPQLIYAAGDLEDPHGTHRLCLRVLREALRRAEAEPWRAAAELWLYRGAWAEWPLDEIDLAVPLSPPEVLRRRRAIFRHETQKDQAIFLGSDQREFWQRTEDRSRRLAQAFDALGLAEYEAMEGFKRYSPEDFVRLAPL
jgi:glucosamine-6-phosphate deaminase